MNSRTWQLLRLLADGEFHSGDALGVALGVSRATVFNLLQDVADYGVLLQRIRGRGYRLAQPWCFLDADEVAGFLTDSRAVFHLEILQQATSSNTELLRRATQGAQSGSVLAVELQTAGRGRIGRVWHSGLGNALTFSLLWRFDCGLNALSGLSLVVGLAVVRALNRFGAKGVGLKWPNDILTPFGKLGGVLIEAQGDMYGPSAVVIGIGINCTLPRLIEREITQPVSSIDQVCPGPVSRNLLLAALLQELEQVLNVFSKRGFSALRAEWTTHHAQQNMPVQLHLPDGSMVSGIACGVSEGGELLLETQAGLRQFNSGEIGFGLS